MASQQPQQQAQGDAPAKKPENVKEKGRALVKAVNSGDSLVLLLTATQTEKELTLAHLTAPRLARKDGKDEPFAWDSRDFLRKKVIGKQVVYTVENKTATNREYGYVYLNETENVAHAVVSEGWAKVMIPTNGKEARGEHAELIALAEAAQAAKLGIWNTDKAAQEKSIRKIPQKVDYLDLYEKLKGKTIEGFIEQVRTGSSFRVLVTDETKNGKQYYNILVRLAGAQCPNIPYSPNKDEEVQGEPFAKEAKLFSEVRLLHRYVNLTLKGLDHKGDSFTAKFVYAGKNVAEELIKAGLATFVDWNAPKEDAELLKATENAAKSQGIRIWHQHKASGTEPKSSSNSTEFTGKVREITNFGALTVADESNGVKKLVAFSSINVPKMGGPGREDEPFAWEAREFLRTRLIGKKVSVSLDYSRTMGSGNETRNFYTVIHDKTNIALLLVEKGLAKVISHKADEKRSPAYEALVLAERKAQKKSTGVQAVKPTQPAPTGKAAAKQAAQPSSKVPVHHVNDLTQPADDKKKGEASGPKKPDMNKIKQFLPFLKRAGRTPAVIEYVVHPTKFKVYVPKESCLINFVIAGVKAPQRRGEEVEPFADESLEYTRKKCHQRDVEIEVESQDKGGNFIGTLWVNKTNFAVTLIDQGFASTTPATAYSSHSNEFYRAEERAKKARKHIWKDYDESQEVPVETTVDENKPRKEYLSVVVTEIVDGGNFFVNVKNDELLQLELLMEKAQEWAEQQAPGYVPNPNDRVLAQFPVDNKWYRAKVVGKNGGEYKVYFVDFGSIDFLPSTALRPLRDNALLAIQPQARECFLAFIKPPSLESDYGRDAAEYLGDLTNGKTMWANVEYRDRDGRLFLSLGDPQSQVHVNAAMVSEGLARVERRSDKNFSQLLQKLREEEEKAKKAHLGIWEYGDTGDDDDEEHAELNRRRGKK